MEEKKDFTGVWIPRHIIEDNDLSITEMIIYAEISCFNECIKSNERLGERWGLKSNTVSIIISKLIKKGYILTNGNKNEHRKLYSAQNLPLIKIKSRLLSKSKPAFDKNQTIDNTEKKKENTIAKQVCESENRKEMNVYEFKEYCYQGGQEHVKFIGDWAVTIYEATNHKSSNLKIKAEWLEYIRRNVKMAKIISGTYSEPTVQEAFQKIKEDSVNFTKFIPSLETLYKYLTK